MNFPFRRTPTAAWAARLPQLERGLEARGLPERAPHTPPAPEPGGIRLTLTTPSRAVAVTAHDIAINPAAAERMPPATLVNAVVATEAENRALRRRLHARKQELHELKRGMADHVVEDAELRGRLRTLEDVIGALHANLEDLRLQRDQLLADAR
ncbi:MAG: hypothetical protein WD557_00065 [Dehalococcoidia bacterium]